MLLRGFKIAAAMAGFASIGAILAVAVTVAALLMATCAACTSRARRCTRGGGGEVTGGVADS